MTERFISENFIVGATNTAGFIAFHPNSGWAVYGNGALSSTTITPSYSSQNIAGNVFLLTNAQKVRGLAACIQGVCSSLSITSITGDIAVGNVSLDTLLSPATISVDSLFSVLQARGAVSRDIKEVKFTPGSFDNRFCQYVSGSTLAALQSTGTDTSDTNAIVFAVRNLPVNTTFNIRITWVVEWTPKTGLGLVPSLQTSAGIKHEAVTTALHTRAPGWWHNLQQGVGSAMSGFANSFMGAFTSRAGEGAGNKFYNMLMPKSAGAGASRYVGPIIEEVEELGMLALEAA